MARAFTRNPADRVPKEVRKQWVNAHPEVVRARATYEQATRAADHVAWNEDPREYVTAHIEARRAVSDAHDALAQAVIDAETAYDAVWGEGDE